MGIQYDTDVTTIVNGGGSKVLPITLGQGLGFARCLLLFFGSNGTAASQVGVSNVQYDSVNATFLTSQITNSGGEYHGLDVYFFLDNDLPEKSGSKNLSWTAAASQVYGRLIAISIYGVKEEFPHDFGSTVQNTLQTSISSPTLSLETDGQWIVDALECFDNGSTRTHTPGAGQTFETEIWNTGPFQASQRHISASTKRNLSAGSGSTSWTISGTGANISILCGVSLTDLDTTTDISVEGSAGSNGNSSGSSTNWNHTLTAETDFLVVCVAARGNIDTTAPVTATFNGIPMIKAVDGYTPPTECRATVFYLLAASLPSPGTYNVAVSAGTSFQVSGCSQGFSNVVQQAPRTAHAEVWGTASESLKVEFEVLTPGAMAVGVLAADPAVSLSAPGLEQTPIYFRNDSSLTGAAQYKGMGATPGINFMSGGFNPQINVGAAAIIILETEEAIAGQSNVGFYGCNS